MFCKRCYADLQQAADHGCLHCLRCKRRFDPKESRSYLSRPFPSRRKIIMHSIINFILATIVSAIVVVFLTVAQLKYMHSNH